VSENKMSFVLRFFSAVFVGLGCSFVGVPQPASALFALAVFSGLGAITKAIQNK
jgi:hypothetical protein